MEQLPISKAMVMDADDVSLGYVVHACEAVMPEMAGLGEWSNFVNREINLRLVKLHRQILTA